MHRQIPPHSAPRRCSYSRSFASIRGFQSPCLPLPPVPRSAFRIPHSAFRIPHSAFSFDRRSPLCVLCVLCGWLSLSSDPRPSFQTRNPEPSLHSCQLYSPSNPTPHHRRPAVLPLLTFHNPCIPNNLHKSSPEKKRSKPAPKRSKKVTKRSKYGLKTSKRPLNRSRIRPKWIHPIPHNRCIMLIILL